MVVYEPQPVRSRTDLTVTFRPCFFSSSTAHITFSNVSDSALVFTIVLPLLQLFDGNVYSAGYDTHAM